MWITSLSMRNWRNFAECGPVQLQRRMFVIGPNASGKSNLLDAFRFLRDVAAQKNGGLQTAATGRGGVGRIRCLSARRNPDVTLAVTVGNADEPNLWEYRLVFSERKDGQGPRVVHEHVLHSGRDVLVRPNDQDRADPELLTQTHLEQVVQNKAFRELVECLRSVRYLHVVPQLVRRGPSGAVVDDPYGSDLLRRMAETRANTRRARLRRICEALQATALPQLTDLRLEQSTDGLWHLRGKYKHWRPQGAWQDETDFSDGTLRLIGILWSLLEPGGLVLMEEPELSLHSALVKELPALFSRSVRRSGAQCIVSTHSWEILADEGLGGDEVLLLTPSPEGTQVVLLNDRQDARELLEAGLSPAEIALHPGTVPGARQLALFGD